MNTLETIAEHNKKSKHKVWLEITNLVIPGLNDELSDIRKMCNWIKKNLGENVPLHFSRFFPYYKAEDIDATPEPILISAKEIAKKAGLNYVYIGNVGMNEDTYCKKCNSLLIERSHYTANIIGLDGKKCKKCKTVLEGVFE